MLDSTSSTKLKTLIIRTPSIYLKNDFIIYNQLFYKSWLGRNLLIRVALLVMTTKYVKSLLSNTLVLQLKS